MWQLFSNRDEIERTMTRQIWQGCVLDVRVAEDAAEQDEAGPQDELVLECQKWLGCYPGDEPANDEPVLACPGCGSHYRLSEYRADAPAIYCSDCNAELPRRREFVAVGAEYS